MKIFDQFTFSKTSSCYCFVWRSLKTIFLGEMQNSFFFFLFLLFFFDFKMLGNYTYFCLGRQLLMVLSHFNICNPAAACAWGSPLYSFGRSENISALFVCILRLRFRSNDTIFHAQRQCSINMLHVVSWKGKVCSRKCFICPGKLFCYIDLTHIPLLITPRGM